MGSAKKCWSIFTLALMGLCVMGLETVTHAGAILQLQDNLGNMVSISDNVGVCAVGGDCDPTLGSIVFVGSLGGTTVWTVNVTTGVTKPVLGSALLPHMDLNSVNVSSGGAGTLTIQFSDPDFIDTFPGLTGFNSAVGGTTNGTAAFAVFVDDANTPLALTTPVGALGPFGPVAFSGTTTGSTVLNDDPYALTLWAQITHETATTSSFDLEVQAVPEPATLLLLGSGLAGLGLIARKKKQAHQA